MDRGTAPAPGMKAPLITSLPCRSDHPCCRHSPRICENSPVRIALFLLRYLPPDCRARAADTLWRLEHYTFLRLRQLRLTRLAQLRCKPTQQAHCQISGWRARYISSLSFVLSVSVEGRRRPDGPSPSVAVCSAPPRYDGWTLDRDARSHSIQMQTRRPTTCTAGCRLIEVTQPRYRSQV